jgi:ABC-type phosphate/phosphonate transport system substrate-binding protein
MIAALPMYDFAWLRPATDALWSAIAHHLGLSIALTRDADLDAIWTAPDLLLAQTCGYPLTTRLDARVVATPIYDAPGCQGAWHRSAIIVRHDDPAATLADLAGRRAAINARDSNTGMNLLRAAVAPHARDGRFFGTVIETGAHRRSLSAVIAGQADVAAIDAVTFALLRDRYPSINRRLRVLDWTASTPGLPLITAAARDDDMVAALRHALDAIGPVPALRLAGFAVLDRRDYNVIPSLERQAIRLGYAVLA